MFYLLGPNTFKSLTKNKYFKSNKNTIFVEEISKTKPRVQNSVGTNSYFHSLNFLRAIISFSLIIFIAHATQSKTMHWQNDIIQLDNDTLISKESIETLIDSSEYYWNINKNISDSLINVVFNQLSNNKENDSVLLADAYHILGKNLIFKRELQEGIDALKKCYQIKRLHISDSCSSISKTLNYIGIGYNNLRLFDSAYYYYNKAKELLVQNSIFDINLYLANLNIGIYYSKIGKYSTALSYFDTAYIVLEKTELINDSSLMSGYYYNYALITTFTGRLKQANNYYGILENIYGELHGYNSINLAGVNNNKGINSYLGCEYSKAELYFKKALDIHKFNESEDNQRIASIHNNLSKVYQKENDFIQTINSCKLGIGYNPDNDLSLTLNKILAISYAAINDKANATKYFLKALELLDNENINPKRPQELYRDYADFLLNTSSDSLALVYYEKALFEASILNEESSDQYAEILSRIGNYYLVINRDAKSAIDYYKKSINIFDLNNIELRGHNHNLITEKQAEIGLAKANRLLYKNTNNIKYLLKADSIIKNVLITFENISSQLTKNNKLLVIEAMYPVYLLSVETSYDIFKLTNNDSYLEAICISMEKSKSSALLAEVNSELALRTSDLPAELFNYEHQLKDEINGIQQMLNKENTKNNVSEANINFFESNLLVLTNKYDSLIAEIESQSPKYYSIKYENNVIGLDGIKQHLKSDEVLLEYLLTNNTIYILAVTHDKHEVVSIPIDSSFYSSLNYVISLKYVDLSKQNLNKFNEFKKHSYKLWKSLIKPVMVTIGHKKLVVIPDGLLGYLPYDLLIEYDFETDKINYRDLPYLLKSHPLSYSYSATLKYNTYFNSSKKTKTNILAFSPTYENNLLSTNSNAEKLRDLPFAKREVKNIVKKHNGEAYIDNDATKQNFKKSAGSAKILHLAMHTIINDSIPLQSRLVFQDNFSDTTSNYMFTHELYSMDLNAAMVTLSACNTGVGKFSKGEGIMSLARGFVYAGVPSIVMTLWEVQDATGSKIMENYYDLLASGLKKDEALQKAKLITLKDANMANAHPFFWSAYIINGDTSELNVSSGNNYYFVILVFVLLIAITIGIVYHTK